MARVTRRCNLSHARGHCVWTALLTATGLDVRRRGSHPRELTLQGHKDSMPCRHQKQSTTHALWELQRQSLFNPSFLTGGVTAEIVHSVDNSGANTLGRRIGLGGMRPMENQILVDSGGTPCTTNEVDPKSRERRMRQMRRQNTLTPQP